MKNTNKKKRPLYFYYFIILIVILVGNYLLSNYMYDKHMESVSYDQFLTAIDEKKIDKVNIGDEDITYTIKGEEKKAYQTETMENDTTLIDKLHQAGATFTREHAKEMNPWLYLFLTVVAPLLLLWWLGNRTFKKMQEKMGGDSMSFGGGGFGNFGKSDAKVYVKSQSGKTFEDVAGQEEAKEALQEMVEFLKNPEKYKKIGAQMPKGALLVGPPGTGKTLLAKAVAGEANVPFFSISGSEFVEMFVGRGAARVRDLFKQAREKAPCIVFIDEVDTIGKKRDGAGYGGNDEREQTLNQMLVEMDGFGVNEGIIVMAATNRVDILDPAILRPGRFDRKVLVGRPDVVGRKGILEVHAKNKPLGEDVDLKKIAQITSGFTGADLENLLNEAAIIAAKSDRAFIIQEDIDKALIKVGVGKEKKSKIISDKEKRITAYHEAGHAILFHVLPDVGPVHTVSVIPTGAGAAGYTMPLPEKDEMFDTKGHMIQEIMVSLGGRIAEEIILDDITTGASQDIKQATAMAKAMVTKYGFSDRLGLINYDNDSEEVFIGRDLAQSKGYAEHTASVIDEEVKNIIDTCYKDAKKIIEDHMEQLQKCAQMLIEKEKINQQEFESIF